jgi:5-hydroxyisourate hydrolase
MGRLTTHVDMSSASRRRTEKEYGAGRGRNLDGRHQQVAGWRDSSRGDFKAGTYELRFHAGAYLQASGVKLDEPAFLDVIPIRFGIANSSQHYHVPLLLSPYGYSTYRGS